MSICTAKYILTTDVYVASMQRHYSLRLRREFKILLKVACALLLALVVFLTFVGIVLPYDRPAPYWAFALIAMISVYGLVHDRVNVWHWKRRFRKNPHGTNNEVEWTFANDAVRMKTPLGEATVKWEAFVKIIDLPRWFLVLPYEGPFFLDTVHFLRVRSVRRDCSGDDSQKRMSIHAASLTRESVELC